jgi:Protein of unknown function (DUF4239)
MVIWLDSLPQWLVLLIFVSVMTLPALLLPRAVHRLRRALPTGDTLTGILEAYKPIALLAPLLMIFTLVAALRIDDGADTLVNREAADILQLDRAATRLPDAEARLLAVLVQDYLRWEIGQEWPAQRHGQNSAAAEAAFRRLLDVAARLRPPPGISAESYADLQHTLDAVADDHAQHLEEVSTGLPDVYWWVVALQLALVLLVGAALPPRRGWSLPFAAHAAALGLLLALLFLVDRPFTGAVSISPAPMQCALMQEK